MAHLNLRDRVIETTIAYVGAETNGGAVNFAHVVRDVGQGRAGVIEHTTVDGGRLLALDWRPRDGAKLNDCDLTVRLVSVEDAMEESALQRVLVDADGLVLVLESEPEAHAQNERAVATVREALARAPQKNVPVVVQINRGEGEGDPAASLGLVVEGWPRVSACAAKGDGVMETLQLAVDGVVASMHKLEAARVVEPGPSRPLGAPRAEGNPLLSSLRQMLQSTVTEQMAAFELRLVERLQAHAATSRSEAGGFEAHVAAEGQAHRDVVSARLASFEGWIERIESTLVEAAERSQAALAETATRADMERIEARVDAAGAAQRDAILRRLASLDAWATRVEATLSDTVKRLSALSAFCERTVSRTDVERLESRVLADANGHRDAVVAEVKELRKGVKEELSRSTIAAVTSAQALQRTLDAQATELKKWNGADATQTLEKLGVAGTGAREQIDALVLTSRGIVNRLDDVASNIERTDTQFVRRVAEIDESLRALGIESSERAASLQAELTGLTEELRKKKKNWFG